METIYCIKGQDSRQYKSERLDEKKVKDEERQRRIFIANDVSGAGLWPDQRVPGASSVSIERH